MTHWNAGEERSVPEQAPPLTISERREQSNRRVPENLMGRRQSDKFEIGEWMRTHYIDPTITAALKESEKRFEAKVTVAVDRAVQQIKELIKTKDSSRDWRSVRIGGGTALLVSFLVWCAAKFKGWL